VARFNESTRALVNQPIIWNSSFAWQYPAIGVDGRGAIAGTVFYGGGSYYPTMASLIWDDYSSAPPPWEVYYVAGSGKGATAWGDWYSARRHGTNAYTWIATGGGAALERQRAVMVRLVRSAARCDQPVH
jgi:hypothetical protein